MVRKMSTSNFKSDTISGLQPEIKAGMLDWMKEQGKDRRTPELTKERIYLGNREN